MNLQQLSEFKSSEKLCSSLAKTACFLQPMSQTKQIYTKHLSSGSHEIIAKQQTDQ